MSSGHGGHLFVIDGDLNKLDCDAVLVPIDRSGGVSRAWAPLVSPDVGGRITDVSFDDGSRAERYTAPAKPFSCCSSGRACRWATR